MIVARIDFRMSTHHDFEPRHPPTTTNLSSIIFLRSGELVPSVTSFADDQARFDTLVRTGSQLLSAFMRAFLLATSAG
jgi:hypothetical protein